MERGEPKLDGLGSSRRSHNCGEIADGHVGTEVALAGWVQGRRDHGGVIFIDLRDRTGIVQVVFRPDASPVAHSKANVLRSEFVILVRGHVSHRGTEAINSEMASGGLELVADELQILNAATPPPFPIEEDSGVDESLRLQHRIHDLRRPPLQRGLELRHHLAQSLRSILCDHGFLEIETPLLTRSTPEGARDFLVPSRIYNGDFYALPQSPQLMKQLLMIAGFERYFQIARCFRDEDQRADRQLEFSQVDLEMSFVGVEDVLAVLEDLIARSCLEVAGIHLPTPFHRLSYSDAMERYGTDRPDTRIQLELVDLTRVFADSEFRAFQSAVSEGGIVKCLPIHDADEISRSEVERIDAFSKKELGAKGVAWIRIGADGGWRGPIVKHLKEQEREAIAVATGAVAGTLLLFQADRPGVANGILARLRSDLGLKLNRLDDRPWEALFVLDFPLFERDDDGSLAYMHMPFVAPIDEDIELLESDPESVRATHYDVVMNGLELGSGSLRNHRSDIQRRILTLLGYSKDEMERRFGFLFRALESGAPPHGGFAFGFDRFAMVLAGGSNLRDVIAFPKTIRGQDLLLGAPSGIGADQIEELGLRVVKRKKS